MWGYPELTDMFHRLDGKTLLFGRTFSFRNVVLIEYDPAKTAASKEIDWLDKNIGTYQFSSAEVQGLDEEEPVIRFEDHTELINGRLFSVRYYITAPDSQLCTVYFDITSYSEHQLSNSQKSE